MDELVMRLRRCAVYLPEKFSKNAEVLDVLMKAADAIEELSGRDTNVPRWIPVTERLPEKYHQVLVYGLNGMQIDYYAGEKSIGGRPLFMISEAKVTHWQPLPEPPKEAGEPLPRGRWVGGELGHCTCCGHEGCASDIWNGVHGDWFCPNCGRRMEGKLP